MQETGGSSNDLGSSGTLRWATFIGSFLLFAALLSRVSLEELEGAFASARISHLMLALVPALLATGLRTLRFGVFHPPGRRWLDLYGTFAWLRLAAYILPFRSGELVSLGVLKQRRLAPNMVETSVPWLLIRLLDLVTLGSLLLVALNLDSQTIGSRWTVAGRAAAVLLGGAGVGALVVFGGWHKFGDRLSRRASGWLGNSARAFDKGVTLVGSPARIGWTLSVSVLVWASQLAANVIVLKAFDPTLAATSCLLASVLALTLTLVPIRAPLGLGTADAAWSAGLVLIGVPLGSAVVLAIAIRVFQMVVVAIDGAIGFTLSLRARATVEQTSAPGA